MLFAMLGMPRNNDVQEAATKLAIAATSPRNRHNAKACSAAPKTRSMCPPDETTAEKAAHDRASRTLMFFWNRPRRLAVGCVRSVLIVLGCLAFHRFCSIYMSNRSWELAPIAFIDRHCPPPSYPTVAMTQRTRSLSAKATPDAVSSIAQQTTAHKAMPMASLTTQQSVFSNNSSASKREQSHFKIVLDEQKETKPRICLVTLSDQKSTSKLQRLLRWRNYDEVYDVTFTNKAQYAEKHGYTLFDGSHLLDPSRPPAWTKVKAIRHLLQPDGNCDWAVWLDADTIVMKSDIEIESLLPATVVSNEQEVIQAQHDLLVSSDYPNTGYNSGVLFFRNSAWSRQFLDDWWNMKSFVRPPGFSLSGDNKALKALLMDRTVDFDQHVLVPSRCSFNSFAMFLQSPSADLEKEEWYKSELFYHKGDFIAHAAGYDNKAQTARLLVGLAT